MHMKQLKYVLHEGRLLGTPCKFLYRSGWDVRKISEEGYEEFFVAGPRDSTGNYTIAFTVVATASPRQTVEEATDELLAAYGNMPGFAKLSRQETTVAGRRAIEVNFEFSMLLPPNSMNPEHAQIRREHVLLKRGDTLWELYYEAPEGDYEAWLDAFHTFLGSFQLPSDTGSHVPYAEASKPFPQGVEEDEARYPAEGGADDEPAHDS